MRSTRSILVLMIALSVSPSSACGAPDTANSDNEPPVALAPSDVDLRTVALPLDAYIYSVDQYQVIDRATAILSTECLRRFGFDVALPHFPEPLNKGHEQMYGVVDAEAASQFGYHRDPAALQDRPAEPEMPPGAYAVMHGEVPSSGGLDVPDGGCLGDARRELQSVNPDLMAPAYALANNAARRAQHDSRVVAAFKQWSECMSERGYQYDDPWQANDDRRWHESEVASTAEIQVALADVECKKKINLTGMWIAVETAYQTRAVEQHSQSLQETKALMDKQLRIALDVLGRATSR